MKFSIVILIQDKQENLKRERIKNSVERKFPKYAAETKKELYDRRCFYGCSNDNTGGSRSSGVSVRYRAHSSGCYGNGRGDRARVVGSLDSEG
ncbi:hypothetical protein HMPREF1992_00331, partial [Selenomonas sp. oral taxon 892 str. F0426]